MVTRGSLLAPTRCADITSTRTMQGGMYVYPRRRQPTTTPPVSHPPRALPLVYSTRTCTAAASVTIPRHEWYAYK
eukprot:1468792-Pyramimonas_sp.AAC.1